MQLALTKSRDAKHLEMHGTVLTMMNHLSKMPLVPLLKNTAVAILSPEFLSNLKCLSHLEPKEIHCSEDKSKSQTRPGEPRVQRRNLRVQKRIDVHQQGLGKEAWPWAKTSPRRNHESLGSPPRQAHL